MHNKLPQSTVKLVLPSNDSYESKTGCNRTFARTLGFTEGYRGTFGVRKRIALQGGVAATVTPVALLCATKHPDFSESKIVRRPDVKIEAHIVHVKGICM